MASVEQSYLRSELERRRERLHAAVHQAARDESLRELMAEVDAALDRMNRGTYGKCETCHEAIETNRLLADPLVCFCLDHLSTAEQRALENDLQLASRIQRALLPNAGLKATGWEVRWHYEPAALVSGDYFDVIESDGSLTFLLGDVAGKGVAASMLMSHLHATFRSLADVGMPLEKMLESANRIFCESTLAGQYATLVVGRAASNGAVELVSAGHLPVLLVRSVGVEKMEATGVPLGMFCGGRFPTRRLQLSAGETLFLHTDGLSESASPEGQEYGLERIVAFLGARTQLSPQDLIAECLADLRKHAGGAPWSDDLTLLALQRRNA